ncbi:MAG: hypothetical protein AB7P04_03915 [Bacteriovoracia bacterium]
MEPQTPEKTQPKQVLVEPEHQGSIWTHPYMVYVLLTIVLFSVLLVVGYLALNNDWIPNRGIAK